MAEKIIVARLKVPRPLHFIQKFKKHSNGNVEYELHLFRRLVFYCRRNSFKECITFRNQWLKDNMS